MTKLHKIEGIGTIFAERLASMGIETMDDLLAAGRTREARIEIAAKVKITSRHIDKWVIQADLARVNGIGSEYADLLRRAGIRSVSDLAKADADQLLQLLRQSNRTYHNGVNRLPAISRIQSWIEKSGELEPLLVPVEQA